MHQLATQLREMAANYIKAAELVESVVGSHTPKPRLSASAAAAQRERRAEWKAAKKPAKAA
jgi:hypothetical protein